MKRFLRLSHDSHCAGGRYTDMTAFSESVVERAAVGWLRSVMRFYASPIEGQKSGYGYDRNDT